MKAPAPPRHPADPGIDWQAHPDPGIEKLLQSSDAGTISSALLHPRIKNDPYAWLRALDRLLQLQPGNHQAFDRWAQTMLMGNRPAAVWERLRHAMQAGTLEDRHYLLAAQVAQVMGDRESAQSLFLQRLQMQETDADAWQKYVEFIAPHTPPDDLQSQLLSLLQEADDAYAEEKFRFSLSSTLLHTDPGKAFSWASSAQDLKRQRLPVWQEEELRRRLLNDRQWARYSKDLPVEPARKVFIVGMPRSGTTLLSSLLGAHSAMSNVGEQNLVPSLASHAGQTPIATAFADFAGKWYAAATADLCREGGISVDKLPANIEYCGFILSCFPDARIIHMQRDAHDCAVSIHLRDFDFGCSYSMSPATIGRYSALASDHAQRLAQLHPQRIISVAFEALLADPENILEETLARLGLPYEGQMLDFWKKRQSTATFSESQVRRPLNSKGRGIAIRTGTAAAGFLARYDQAFSEGSP